MKIFFVALLITPVFLAITKPQEIILKVLMRLGCDQEEAQLVSAEFCQERGTTTEDLLNEFRLNEISKFWKQWKIKLYSTILPISNQSALPYGLMTYKTYKILTASFEELQHEKQTKNISILKAEPPVACPKKPSSFHL